MTDLSERIRQAFGDRDAQEKQRIETKILKKKEEENRISEINQLNYQELLIARKIFENVNPNSFLETVKRDVWGGVGDISNFETDRDVYARLEYIRKGIFYDSGVSGENGGSPYCNGIKGKYHHCFEIRTNKILLDVSFEKFFIESYEKYPKQLNNLDKDDPSPVYISGENYSKAKEELSLAIMSICRPRIINGTWPFEK